MQRYARPIKIISGIIFLVLIFYFFAPRALSSFFSSLFSPLWNVAASSFSSENAKLRQQLEAHSADSTTIAALEQENSELKVMLGRVPTKNTVLAVIIKKPPFSTYDSLIIDIGTDHAIIPGSMVYASSPAFLPAANSSSLASTTAASSTALTASSTQGIAITSNVKVPIGLVSEVDSTTSKVDLFSSPDKKYNVEIGKSHIAAVATGQGAGTFATVLPREAKVAVGDIVIIPSITPSVFAVVTSIVSDPARPYANILFQSPVNPFSLHWVEVDAKAPQK